MKHSKEFLCEEGIVLARFKIQQEVAFDPDENRAIDKVVSAAMTQIATKMAKHGIKCEGRCLDCDDCDCLVSIEPNLRNRVVTALFGFFQDNKFTNQKYKATLFPTVVEISCSCEERTQEA